MSFQITKSCVDRFLLRDRVLAQISKFHLQEVSYLAWQCMFAPKRLRGRFEVQSDLDSFRKKFRSQFKSVGGSKKVLIVSLSDSVFQMKSESLLAKSLVNQGYKPVVVTKRAFGTILRYYDAVGLTQRIYWDEFVYKNLGRIVSDELKQFINRDFSFSSLLEFKYHDVLLGKHMMSLVARTVLRGSIEFDHPQVRKLLERWFCEGIKTVLAAEMLYDQEKPDLVLFLEKGYSPFGEFFDVAVNRGIDVIQWTHAQRADSFLFKRYHKSNRDSHQASLSPETWKRVQSMEWSDKMEAKLMNEIVAGYKDGTWFNRKFLHAGKKIKPREEVIQRLGIDPKKKTAVIYSHVLWDATFFHGRNLFDDYEQWLIETVKVACGNTSVNWVIKIHPDYVWKMKQMGDGAKSTDLIALGKHILKLPEHIKILTPETDISTYSIFQISDYCLTVRGTVGIEMACFGVPVFTAGSGRYSGLGFTRDSDSRESYLEKIKNIQNYGALTDNERTLARRYAYAVFLVKPYCVKTFQMTQLPLDKMGHFLDHNVAIRSDSLQEIVEELKPFSEWAAHSTEEDCLSAGK